MRPRVGIEFPFRDLSWLGGISALSNLVAAVSALEKPQIAMVLVASQDTPDSLLRGFDHIPVLRTSLIDPSRPFSLAGRLARRTIGRNVLLERWLRRHHIDVFSHCSALGVKAAIPTIGHIADFGYRYFGELYPPDGLNRLDEGTRRICEEHKFIIFSSQAALGDYRKFFPRAKADGVVINIPPPNVPQQASSVEQLQRKYGIPRRYVYSPNQFWVHKNHLAIVEALAIAKQRGSVLHVVCTGLEFDPRRPDHAGKVLERAEELGVADLFHVLGIVPYEDAMDLMRHSSAVLSASFFEGWGISISEAKSLGKIAVLSDIPVFHEHGLDCAFYFDPTDPADLAVQLIEAEKSYSREAELRRAAVQEQRRPAVVKRCALEYERLVIAAAGGTVGAQ